MTVELSSTQGLNLWCDPSVDSSRKEATDLTSHQLALFLKVYLTPQPQAVRGPLASPLAARGGAIGSHSRISQLFQGRLRAPSR